MEFHISRKVRDFYKFDESLYGFSGNVIFANFLNVRKFVQKINAKRDLVRFPELAVRAGDINAMGLIDEILHLVAATYREQINPVAMSQAVKFLEEKIGGDKVDQAIRQFSDQFPPLAAYKGSISLEAYLAGENDGIPNRTAAIEEMLLLWLANANPAFSPYSELFDDEALEKQTVYKSIIDALQTFFDAQLHFGPDDQSLILMLRSPALASPYSLEGQLEYIRSRWGKLLGKYLYKLLSSLDLMHEERKSGFVGPGPTEVVDFSSLTPDHERFSPDSEWMPRVVMIAKNTYVWLDQLSKKYRRKIHRLDQVPDEELDLLGRWGFTSLWLIGLWERSIASKRIKQMCGNPDAEASAYSLKDYEISADLGGDEAFQSLKMRAWQRGIRMAGDMVPNHVGIDGRWVIQHPDWFLSLNYCPYPSYTFNGPNLSSDDRVGIYLEDHYYTRSDAAVVFKRVDQWTGDTKYVYHGNDGTSMPWNDTAQLNYLNPETREAVIQTILHVARQFPVIRFDAAMTLAKKHIQRLWFPEPGSGGAIPSRSEHGLSRADFEKAIPAEFWREVVDRVAKEAPDTLLLAEAIWLLEGYFVRTLGMHRVYNSAFMNMLKNEENAKYRSVIKNTLEFDPEILKRYVNFMNNPDEDTAVAQFGRDDKYFGVCVLLSTLPGLPMFGHGQIEGYTEKYGMEFRRAYWDEQPDPWLIGRHEREIFPILRKRYLFTGVQDFLLYDFFTPEGQVNENVFAYSNRSGSERALVVYNNVYGASQGWIRISVAYIVKDGDQKRTLQKTLGQGLTLSERPDTFCVFRDQISGLEYIRNCKKIHEQGLFVKLDGYQYHVFINFREVRDREGEPYRQLADYLGGRGVPGIEEALTEIFLQPVHGVFKLLVNARTLHAVIEALIDSPAKKLNHALLDDFTQSMDQIAAEIGTFIQRPETEYGLGVLTRNELDMLLRFPAQGDQSPILNLSKFSAIQDTLNVLYDCPDFAVSVLFHWITVHRLGAVQNPQDSAGISRSWIDEWLLGKIIADVISELSLSEENIWQAGLLIRILTVHHDWFSQILTDDTPLSAALENLFHDQDVLQFLRINRHQEVLWYNQESFEMLFRFLTAVAIIELLTDSETTKSELKKRLSLLDELLAQINKAEQKSGYQVEKLVEA
ncbi:alpha-amylase, partial [candidate division KSB1 bacterium]|nr:alpha-amylase [candidate division KSB1 bacterium]